MAQKTRFGIAWKPTGSAILCLTSLWLAGVAPALADSDFPPAPDAPVVLPPWEHFAAFPGDQVPHTEFSQIDLNGDGIPDDLLGAPAYDENDPQFGRVVVTSGWDGDPHFLFDVTSETENDLFGSATTILGNFFGDGHRAIAAGAPLTNAGAVAATGRVYVYGGPQRDLLMIIDGVDSNAGLGVAIADLGDINGDGRTDIAIGAPGNTTDRAGKVHIFHGRDPAAGDVPIALSTLDADVTLSSPDANDWFGFRLASGADFNGDGIREIAVGAPVADIGGIEAAGAVHLFDGATGSLIASVHGQSTRGIAGSAIEMIPASTVLPAARLVIGAPGEALAGLDPAAYTPGRVAIFTGATLDPTGAGGNIVTLAAADVTLPQPAGQSLFGSSVERGYAVPGTDTIPLIVASSAVVPAPAHMVTELNLDPAITWFATLSVTSVYNPPYTTAAYTFATGIGSDQELSHPYPGPENPPTAQSPLSMKEYGDVSGNYLVDLDDIFLILTKMGASGADALDADVNEDGRVTIDDLVIALNNEGMGLREAIHRRCGWIPDPYPDGSGGGGWSGGIDGCECVNYWLNNAPDGIVIGDPEDGDPCIAGDGDEPGGGDPPVGVDCSEIPIEEPADCTSVAACLANNTLGDQINALENAVHQAEDALAAARINAENARDALETAELDVNVQHRIVLNQAREGAQITARDLKNSARNAIIAGALAGGAGGTVIPVIGTVSGIGIGVIVGASVVLISWPDTASSIGAVINAHNSARSVIDAAAAGGTFPLPPNAPGQGINISLGRWTALTGAGAAWSAARTAYDAALAALETAQENLDAASAALEGMLQQLQGLTNSLRDACLELHFP